MRSADVMNAVGEAFACHGPPESHVLQLSVGHVILAVSSKSDTGTKLKTENARQGSFNGSALSAAARDETSP